MGEDDYLDEGDDGDGERWQSALDDDPSPYAGNMPDEDGPDDDFEDDGEADPEDLDPRDVDQEAPLEVGFNDDPPAFNDRDEDCEPDRD